jgi:hypothetical protein
MDEALKEGLVGELMETRRQTETRIVKRVCDFAGVIRAASWPNVGALQAIEISVRFIRLIEQLRLMKGLGERNRP